MQNWKIKRMSYKRINVWLQAIASLLNCYEKRKKVKWCPLCIEVGCENCLWKILEGKQCFDYQEELGIEGDMTEIRNRKKWQTLRIPMLKRWKKILKTELARRENCTQ